MIRLVRGDHRSVARDEVLLRHIAHPDREVGLVVVERLVALDPASDSTAVVLDLVMQDDVRHAARILASLAAMDAAADDAGATDEPLRRAIGDEFDLVCSRVKAGRLARYGAARLGPPMVELDAGRPSSSLAVEALQVLLAPREVKQVLALLERDLPVAERLARLPIPWATRRPRSLLCCET